MHQIGFSCVTLSCDEVRHLNHKVLYYCTRGLFVNREPEYQTEKVQIPLERYEVPWPLLQDNCCPDFRSNVAYSHSSTERCPRDSTSSLAFLNSILHCYHTVLKIHCQDWNEVFNFRINTMVAAKVVCLKISTISVSKGNMLSSWKLESSNFVSCDFSPQTSSPLFPNQGRKTIIRASKQSKADGQYSDDFGSEWMKLEGFNSEVSSSWTDSVMESSLRHRIEELSTSGQEPVPDPPSLECEEEKATIEDMHQVLSDKVSISFTTTNEFLSYFSLF